MSPLQSVDSYAMLENPTLRWPISTTKSFSSPSHTLLMLNQTQTKEKITELKSKISFLEKEKKSIERAADQIQLIFLGIYKISDRLIGELLTMEAAKRVADQVQRFFFHKTPPFRRSELVAKVQAGHLSAKRISLLKKLESALLKIDQMKKSIQQRTEELNRFELKKDLQSDIPFTYSSCDTHLTTPISVLCEIWEIRKIYLLDFAMEQFISDKIHMINNQIQPIEKEIKSEGKKIKKNNPLEVDMQKLKTKIKNQEKERLDIQKMAWEIQNLLKKSCFLSTGLMYHILSHSFSEEKVHTLIQKRTSFRYFLLTQVEKLLPGEKEKAVQEPLRKIEEEEPQASAILDRNSDQACRDENRRTILYHQLASEITGKSNQTIDSINEKINDLKERLKLLQVPSKPKSLKLTASMKLLSSTALIGYGLGGVAGLSMVIAIVWCVFWLRKSKAPQRRRLVTMETGENIGMLRLEEKEKKHWRDSHLNKYRDEKNCKRLVSLRIYG